MLCKKCNAQLPENTNTCPECGEKVNKKSAKKIIVSSLLSVVALAVISVVLYLLVFGLKGYRNDNDLIDDYVKNFFNTDAEGIIDMMPEDMQEAYIEAFESEDELIRGLKDELSTSLKNISSSYGKDYEYSYEITSESEYTDQDIDAYTTMAKELGIEHFEPTAVKEIEITLTITTDSFTGTEYLNISIAQMRGKWYLIGFYNGI